MHLSIANATELSETLLQLYRLSHESPIDQFQSAALALLRERLPFDSSMWGTATHTGTGIDIHAIHLENQPVEMLENYERVKHMDTAAQRVRAHPRHTIGFNTNDWFGRPEQAELREHGRRFEQANFFITGDLDPATNFVHWITLFRGDEEAHCTVQEQALLSLLAPHVMQALTQNRVQHLGRMVPALPEVRCSAIADARGMLCHVDSRFEEMLRGDWPGWRGPNLPAMLTEHFRGGHSRWVGAHAVVSQRFEHSLLFLSARERCKADALSEREQLVAQLLARGGTYKEIARTLERAPATVRNQIRSIYEKLEVANVAGLIEELRRAL